MTREEFCKYHWEYFLVLEKDLLDTERFVSFDLGEDTLYNNFLCNDYGNSKCFSNEFIKQYQAICSEVDVILKTICKEININSKANNMEEYTSEVLNEWPEIIKQKVLIKEMELQPFLNWKVSPYNSPDWWSPYNKVKHQRISNYKKANLKNVLNSLAALYILEQYLVKYIGDRDSCYDVPNNISKLFKMVNYHTRETVVGIDSYILSNDDIDKILSTP